MRRALFVAAATLAVGCAAAPGAAPRAASVVPVGALVVLSNPVGGGRFLGSEACRRCHPAAFARWRATGHAVPYAGLTAPDRVDPACLRCHVTGYAASGGYASDIAVADLAAVGCEACHGAGADHALSRYPGLVPTATGGECPPCEANRLCRLCHTPERSPDFELKRDLARVACRP